MRILTQKRRGRGKGRKERRDIGFSVGLFLEQLPPLREHQSVKGAAKTKEAQRMSSRARKRQRNGSRQQRDLDLEEDIKATSPNSNAKGAEDDEDAADAAEAEAALAAPTVSQPTTSQVPRKRSLASRLSLFSSTSSSSSDSPPNSSRSSISTAVDGKAEHGRKSNERDSSSRIETESTSDPQASSSKSFLKRVSSFFSPARPNQANGKAGHEAGNSTPRRPKKRKKMDAVTKQLEEADLGADELVGTMGVAKREIGLDADKDEDSMSKQDATSDNPIKVNREELVDERSQSRKENQDGALPDHISLEESARMIAMLDSSAGVETVPFSTTDGNGIKTAYVENDSKGGETEQETKGADEGEEGHLPPLSGGKAKMNKGRGRAKRTDSNTQQTSPQPSERLQSTSPTKSGEEEQHVALRSTPLQKGHSNRSTPVKRSRRLNLNGAASAASVNNDTAAEATSNGNSGASDVVESENIRETPLTSLPVEGQVAILADEESEENAEEKRPQAPSLEDSGSSNGIASQKTATNEAEKASKAEANAQDVVDEINEDTLQRKAMIDELPKPEALAQTEEPVRADAVKAAEEKEPAVDLAPSSELSREPEAPLEMQQSDVAVVSGAALQMPNEGLVYEETSKDEIDNLVEAKTAIDQELSRGEELHQETPLLEQPDELDNAYIADKENIFVEALVNGDDEQPTAELVEDAQDLVLEQEEEEAAEQNFAEGAAMAFDDEAAEAGERIEPSQISIVEVLHDEGGEDEPALSYSALHEVSTPRQEREASLAVESVDYPLLQPSSFVYGEVLPEEDEDQEAEAKGREDGEVADVEGERATQGELFIDQMDEEDEIDEDDIEEDVDDVDEVDEVDEEDIEDVDDDEDILLIPNRAPVQIGDAGRSAIEKMPIDPVRGAALSDDVIDLTDDLPDSDEGERRAPREASPGTSASLSQDVANAIPLRRVSSGLFSQGPLARQHELQQSDAQRAINDLGEQVLQERHSTSSFGRRSLPASSIASFSLQHAPASHRYRKKDPIGSAQSKTRARDMVKAKLQVFAALKVQAKKLVHGRQGLDIDEMLSYGDQLRRKQRQQAAIEGVDEDRDIDFRTAALRRLLSQGEQRARSALRTSRYESKKLAELDRREKERLKRLRGILGRQSLPSTLGDEYERVVDETLRKRGKIAAIPGAGVEDRDIEKLRPGKWLNDEVINFYMKLIQLRSDLAVKKRQELREVKDRVEKSAGSSEKPSEKDVALIRQSKKWRAFWDVHVFNSFFWQKLTSPQGYASVSKWTRRVDIFQKDLVLIPINMGGLHWICAAINLRRRRFEVYDSMASSHAKGSSLFRTLRHYLAAEYCEKKGCSSADDLHLDEAWTDYFSEESPQQANGTDCGVFAVMTLEQLSRRDPVTEQPPALTVEVIRKQVAEAAQAVRNGEGGGGGGSLQEQEEWNFSQADMLYLRRRMVYEIAKAELLE